MTTHQEEPVTRVRRIPTQTPTTPEEQAARAAARAAEEAKYPAVVVRTLDIDGVVGHAQFFPTSTIRTMAVGFVIVRLSGDYDQRNFAEAVERHTEFYATTINVKPTWVDGAYYLRNYFGMYLGPLDATTDEAAYEEALDSLGRSEGYTVIDER